MWEYYNPNPVGRKVGDCAVRAIAKALGIDWEAAYALIASNGFLMGDMPSSDSVWGATLRQNGFNRSAIPNSCPDCYTAADFCKDHPRGTYVLGFGGNVGGELYPWMNQSNITANGFQNQMLNDNITSIRDGIGGISTQLCNGFAGVNATVNSGFANAEASANARQIADMQTAFAAQTAMAQGFNQLGTQFANCCCENRLANCQTQNIIQNEASATRFADVNNTRDIIQSQTNGTQAILDKLCQLELDNKDAKIADLERQLTQANLAASQTAQNAFIAQGFANEVDQLYTRLSNCPIPSTPVFGRTQIFTCNNNGGCGCGNNF